jgi:hypothetical protein
MAQRKRYAVKADLEKAKSRMQKGLRAQAEAQDMKRQRQVAQRDIATAKAVHHGSPQVQERAMNAKAQSKSEIESLQQLKEAINKQHRDAEAAKPTKTPTGENIVLTPEQQARAAERKRTGKFQAGAHKGEATPAAVRQAERAQVNDEIREARQKLAGSARKPDVLRGQAGHARGPDVLQNTTRGRRPRPLVPGQTIHTPEGPKVVGFSQPSRMPRVGPKRVDGPRPGQLKKVRGPRRRRTQNSLY